MSSEPPTQLTPARLALSRMLLAWSASLEPSPFECDHCGDGDALRPGEACAYCGFIKESPQIATSAYQTPLTEAP